MLSRYVHIRSLQCVKIICKFTERFLRNRSFCRGTFFGRTLYKELTADMHIVSWSSQTIAVAVYSAALTLMVTRRMAIANGTCVSFCTFWPPWVCPWDNRGKCYMDQKRIQCWSNVSQHIPIYLQPFTSYSEILVGNCNFFIPLAFHAPVGVFPLDTGKKFGPQKTRIMGLPGSEDSLTIGWAVSTQYQRVADRQTDGQTILPIAITCPVWLTHVKNSI